MKEPVYRDKRWYCADCGACIDTDFIDQPRRCDVCGVEIDWSGENYTHDIATLNARLGLLECRIVAIIDTLKAHGLLG